MKDDDGARVLMHLSQAGRVDIEERPKTTRPKGAVVRLRFATPDGEPSDAVLVREHGTQMQTVDLLHLRTQLAYRREKYVPSAETEALARETFRRAVELGDLQGLLDRKSTRLNSSH